MDESTRAGAGTPPLRARSGWVFASAAAALGWTALVAASPPGFFVAAAPYAAVWGALSLMAFPVAARLRPGGAADVALGIAVALALYAGTRLFLWALCGGASDVLCAPLGEMFARFHTRGLGAALALGLVIAPAEELFWRGVVQARLAARVGGAAAVAIATALAAAVSLASGEPFLALAVVPTYATWGALAAWRGRLAPAVVSHAVWSVLVASAAPPV